VRRRIAANGRRRSIPVDDADDGDPRMYIHDPKVDKHVIVGAPADDDTGPQTARRASKRSVMS
jgi:hypothetical protein